MNALAFLLNLMSGLRAFHILQPLIQILNAFLEVLLNLTLKLRVLFLMLPTLPLVYIRYHCYAAIFRNSINWRALHMVEVLNICLNHNIWA